MTDHYDLSRRKVIAGLGTIGVAGAGAGLGTSAYFSDEESFEDNMLTAGSLDLIVDYDVAWDQGSAGDGSYEGSNNGDSLALELGDVKPGDSGTAEFCFRIDDNPAYLWACGELTATNENDYTEPEPEDDNGEGELEEAIQVDVAYCPEKDGDGEVDGEPIFSGTLRETLTALQGGLVLDGTGDADAVAGSQAPYDGTENDSSDEDVTNPCVCFDWELPTSVGNEIQTDSVAFDLQFYAEQARHNDGATNPCVDATFTSDEVYVHRTSDLGFGNEQVAVSDINDANDDGAPKLRPVVVEVSYGEQLVVYNVHPTLGMEDPSNMAIGFDPEADGGAWDEQVLWESGGGGFSYIENGGIDDDPANVQGVSASYDDTANAFTIGLDRDTLEAGSDDYRFAMQSIHEPGASNNPLNPDGSNARVDAELPSGFDWGDTSTWQDDTLQ